MMQYIPFALRLAQVFHVEILPLFQGLSLRLVPCSDTWAKVCCFESPNGQDELTILKQKFTVSAVELGFIIVQI